MLFANCIDDGRSETYQRRADKKSDVGWAQLDRGDALSRHAFGRAVAESHELGAQPRNSTLFTLAIFFSKNESARLPTGEGACFERRRGATTR